MPKRIDSTVWRVIKSAFLQRDPKPSYKALAKEFGVSSSSIETKAAKDKWQAERDTREQGKVVASQKISQASGRKVDPQVALDGAISDLYYEATALEGKSKEGCANAMANLLKTQRELYPPTFAEWVDMVIKFNIQPTPDDIVELTIQSGITPDTFMEALKRRWSQGLEPAPESVPTSVK